MNLGLVVTGLALVMPAASWLMLPSTAAAFLSRGSFAISPSESGGGQRYFTGSPTDSQPCGVCHNAEGDAGLMLSGAPIEYVPGQTYEISLSWAAGAANLSGGSLEIVDRNNAGIGITTLIPIAQLTPEERCGDGSGAVDPAAPSAATLELIESRQIAGTEVCGATKLRVRWNAPPVEAGPAWIYAVGVSADGDNTPAGDVASALRTIVSPQGAPADVAEIKTCALAPWQQANTTWSWLGLCVLVVWIRALARRRGQRTLRRASR